MYVQELAVRQMVLFQESSAEDLGCLHKVVAADLDAEQVAVVGYAYTVAVSCALVAAAYLVAFVEVVLAVVLLAQEVT